MKTHFYFTQDFESYTPFWHLFTNGNDFKIIFQNDSDYIFGMNILAVCACLFPDVKILTFVLMSNHIHFILSGEEKRCKELFECFKWKLSRGLYKNISNWKNFQATLAPIGDEDYLRTAIAYVNRNAYVAHPQFTPYNYQWGAAKEFFTKQGKRPMKSFSDLTETEKRLYLHTHKFNECMKTLRFDEHIVDTRSFCHIDIAEKFFLNARDYINLLFKNVESNQEIAQSLRDEVMLTDEELNKITYFLIKDRYSTTEACLLTIEQRIDLGLELKKNYNASRKQIKRCLSLDSKSMEKIFPPNQQVLP